LNRITDAFGLAWSNMHANQARVAWCGNPDPMDLIVSDLLRRRVAVTRVSSRPGKRRQDTVERERIASLLAEKAGSLMATDAFWQVLDPVSPALRAFAEPFLKRWLLDQVPLAWVQFQNVRDWLRSGRFSALICTEIQDPVNSSILMAAEALALPRITCVHNPTNGVVDGPAIDCLGPIQSDVHLVAGEGEARYYRTFENRLDVFGRAKEIAVGSPRLDALRNSSERQSAARLRAAFTAGDSLPLILYIPTNLTGCYRYFNEGHISDVAYFELQQRMVKVFAEFPNVRLLYKPFRSEFATNPIPEFISEFVPNGRVVFTPLTELVWAVDAIIIDYPSTPLVEAALTDKPIIVYAGRNWARMPSEAKQALEKRAWVSEAPDEFESQGRQFLTAGNFVPLASPDDEFLRLYATHLNDGRSAERAADVILNIVAEQETLRSRTLN